MRQGREADYDGAGVVQKAIGSVAPALDDSAPVLTRTWAQGKGIFLGSVAVTGVLAAISGTVALAGQDPALINTITPELIVAASAGATTLTVGGIAGGMHVAHAGDTHRGQRESSLMLRRVKRVGLGLATITAIPAYLFAQAHGWPMAGGFSETAAWGAAAAGGTGLVAGATGRAFRMGVPRHVMHPGMGE